MKFILAFALASFSAISFAQEASFEELKTMMTQKIDTRIGDLNAAKACVSAATTKEALKTCHKELKAKREAAKEAYKDKKEEWKAKRKAGKK